MKIFCQACFEASRKPELSVWDANTNGTCSHCGSSAVLSADVVAGAQKAAERRLETEISEDNWSLSPQGGRGKRLLEENESHLSAADVRALLVQFGATELEEWWDGCYFWRCSNFLYCVPPGKSIGRYVPTLDLMLENRNGSQRYITFEVTMKLLEITDSNEFSSKSS